LHPLLNLALSILLFFALDAVIFRSGLYAKVVSPETTAGKLLYTASYERARPANPDRDVLLLGNSKMEFAFWVKHFEVVSPNSKLHFIQGAVSGSTEEWWHYMLQYLDPNRDRYAAIVIPISGYKIGPVEEDFQNRFENAQDLAPILRLPEWPDFLATYSDASLQRRAALLAAFSSHDYALDLQNLLLDPMSRWEKIAWRHQVGERWMYEDEGLTGTMEGLKVDPATQRVTAYPVQFTEFKRRETDAKFIRPDSNQAASLTARDAAVEDEWVKRIVADYVGSRTKVIFLQIPRWPFPLPSSEPLPSAPDVRDMIPAVPNVVVMDPDAFTSLEKSRYFYDTMHLNGEGRRIFTEQFGAKLEHILGGQS
jgi:hypothetical protein